MRIKFPSLLVRPFVFTRLFARRPTLCVIIQSCREDPRLSASECIKGMCAWSCKGIGRFQNNHLSSPEQSTWRVHQKTLASSCGHIYIINAHVCRCGHTGTRDRVQPHYKQPCEICFSNHLGFEQLSSDERASFVSKTEICKPWAEIPCSPHSHPQVGAITGTVFLMCVSVYLSAVECTSFIFSPLKSGLSFLCWAQVSLYTYMSSFLQIISCIKRWFTQNAAQDWVMSLIGSTKSSDDLKLLLSLQTCQFHV